MSKIFGPMHKVLVPPQQKIQAHAEFLYLFEERQARIQQQYSSPTPK